MKKKLFVILIVLILSMNFFTILPTNSAAVSTMTYQGNVVTQNDLSVPTTEFLMGTNVYFSVHVEDEYGQNLTSYVYAYVYAYYSSYAVDTVYINLDLYGNGSGYFNLDSAYSAGKYRIDIKQTTDGFLIAQTSFDVIEITYNVNLDTYDTYPDEFASLTSEFKSGDTIYFQISVTDDSNNPASYDTVYIMLYDQYENRINYVSVYLDYEGKAIGYLSISSYSYVISPGKYELKVAFSLYDDSIFEMDIDVIERKYFATITTWNSNPYYSYARQTNVFDINEYVYFTVHIEDDEGEPYYSGYYYSSYAYVNLSYESSHIAERSVSIDSQGNGTSYFDLSDYYDLEYGKYTLEIKIQSSSDVIGSHDIFVVDFDLTIDKYEYAPDEMIKITISITPADLITKLNVKIINSTTKALKKQWTNQKLSTEGGLYLSYKLPSNIEDGEYNVTVTDSDGSVLDERQFIIKFFKLILYSERSTYLAGDYVNVFYSLTSLKDGSGIESANYDWKVSYPLIKNYCPYYWQHEDMDDAEVSEGAKTCSMDHEFDEPTKRTDYESKRGSFKATSSLGDFEIRIPMAAENGRITIDVEVKDRLGKHSSSSSIYVYIGTPDVNIYTDLSNYSPGDFVIVTASTEVIYSYYGYQRSPLEQGNIQIKFYEQNKKTGEYDELKSYKETGLKTDANGKCQCIVELGEALSEGTYKFEATVSKSGVEISEDYDSEVVYINIGDRISLMAMELYLNERYYHPGETAEVNYNLAYMDTNKGVENAIIDYSVYYYPFEYGSKVYVKVDRFKSQKSEGKLEFKIPDNYNGELSIHVTATNDTGGVVSKYVTIIVNYANLILNVDKAEFDPGDLITVDYELTSFSEKIDFYYKVIYYSYDGYGYDNQGLLIEKSFRSSNPKNSFNFTIPEVGAADEYYIRMYALDSKGHYTENNLVIEKREGYILTIELDKSKFKCGEKIKVNYKLIPQGLNEPPEHIIFSSNINSMSSQRFETCQAEGTFYYEIPDNVSFGNVLFIVGAEVDPESGYYSTSSIQSIDIIEDRKEDEESDELSPKKIIQTLGISSFDLILIIFIIAILVLLVVIKRRVPAGEKKKKEKKRKLTREEKKQLKAQKKLQKKMEKARKAGIAPSQPQGAPAPTPASTYPQPGPQAQPTSQTTQTQPTPMKMSPPSPQQTTAPRGIGYSPMPTAASPPPQAPTSKAPEGKGQIRYDQGPSAPAYDPYSRGQPPPQQQPQQRPQQQPVPTTPGQMSEPYTPYEPEQRYQTTPPYPPRGSSYSPGPGWEADRQPQSVGYEVSPYRPPQYGHDPYANRQQYRQPPPPQYQYPPQQSDYMRQRRRPRDRFYY